MWNIVCDSSCDFKKLETENPDIRYVTPLTEMAPGRRIIRIYDPDGNLIEIGTP